MTYEYQFRSHIIIPRSELVLRTYCGQHEFVSDYEIPDNRRCSVCYDDEGGVMNNVPLADNAARMVGVGMNFDTDTYRELFNGFLKDPTVLSISHEKPIVEMTNEELTAWINKLEDFVRIAKVAKQAAHVTLEDRRLQMTEEQRAEQRRLDLRYKPATVKTEPKKERKASGKAKLTQEQKIINATIDLMGWDKQKSIVWLKTKNKLPADYPEE